ncbi:MAG: zinc ribbon domain-containing protein [Clostridia bacterium]|nr:zinc ribbon domain-containing protein [Clostridia bacterium]
MADIFDKFVDGLNKGVATVGANSKAMIEKAKVNNTIKALEDEKKQLAELLGMRIYDMYIAGQEIVRDEIANFATEITNRIELVAVQHEMLKKIEAEANMASGIVRGAGGLCKCGFTNPDGARFCAKCGTPLT